MSQDNKVYSNTTAGEEPCQTWCNEVRWSDVCIYFPLLHSCLFHLYIRLGPHPTGRLQIIIFHSHMKEKEIPLIYQMFSQDSNEIKYRENRVVYEPCFPDFSLSKPNNLTCLLNANVSSSFRRDQHPISYYKLL